jgi:Zn-dependent protease with chaperone function
MGVRSAWPSPVAAIAFATLPVLALLSVSTVRDLLADLPLGRGEAITSIWLGLALGTLALAVVGIVALPVALALGRRRPWLLVELLERGVRLALVGLGVLVACEAVLASGLALILEQLLFGRAFPGTIAITMIGGFVGLFYLLRTAITYPSRAVEMTAIEIDAKRERALETMYRDLAARLSIAPPDHVVIGPEIRFAVTRAPVVLDDRTLVGTTLYLSWPLLRVLSSDQTAAIVAHELAHIAASHLDTGHRLDRGMGRLREAADRLDTEVYDNAFARIATQPAAIWLRQMFVAIRGVLAVQQQPDELEADRIAAALVGADVLGDALVTYTVAATLSPVWNHLLADPRAIMRARGQPPTEPFAEAVAELLSSENLDELLAAGDPMATHPPAAERLRRTGVVPTPAVAQEPALTTLITGSREIASALSRRMREGPNMIRDDVINPIRFEVGLAGLLVVVGSLGVFTLLMALSGEASRIRANAVMWGLILMVVIGVAGVIYTGLQQEVVIDEGGVSATGWFRRLLGRRSRSVSWSSISRATLGRARSIKVATRAGSLEIYGTWLNDRDIRRIIEGLRSHGVPIRFKLGARGFDDERRAVIWLIGDAFLVPTLRRADDGRIVETEPIREIPLKPQALFNAIARELGAAPKSMGRRARPVDVSASRAVGRRRRIVIAGSRNHSTIRIDGFEDHWWDDGPPDAGRAVVLIFDVFELDLTDDEDAEIER